MCCHERDVGINDIICFFVRVHGAFFFGTRLGRANVYLRLQQCTRSSLLVLQVPMYRQRPCASIWLPSSYILLNLG